MARRPHPAPLLVALAACAVVGGALAVRHKPHRAPAPVVAPVDGATPAPSAPALWSLGGRAPERGTRARYRLRAESDANLGARALASHRVAGTWTRTERSGGIVEVALAATEIAAEGEPPVKPADVAAPFVLATREGTLAGIGFAPGTSDAARNLLTSLATTLQLTERRDAAWTVEEEDLDGRYEAHYTREGARVRRARGAYTMLRGDQGRAGSGAGGIACDEDSEFVVDRRGLVSATVKLTMTLRPSPKVTAIVVHTSATIERDAASDVELSAALPYERAPITARVDRAALARQAREQLVGGASTNSLLDEAATAARATGRPADVEGARAAAMRRLAAKATLDPAVPAHIADALRSNASDHDQVALLAGALGSSTSPAASRALASLLADPLPGDARAQVLVQLGLSHAPSDDTLAALRGALDGPNGEEAALALGSQANHLGEVASGDAIDVLLARFEAASTPEERRAALAALGNTASRRVLSDVQGALQDPDLDVAREAAFDLRLIPGDDVDDLLWDLMRSGSSVMLSAITACGYRSAALWTPRLQSLSAALAGQRLATDAINTVLHRFAPGGAAKG